MSDWLIVGAVIIIAVLFLVYHANKEPSFNPPQPKQIVKMDLTHDQLKQYNGISNPKTFIALKG